MKAFQKLFLVFDIFCDKEIISQYRTKHKYINIEKEVSLLEKYLSCEDIANKFDVKIITVWSWIREKKLKAIKIGKMYRITPQDLLEFEESRRVK